MIKHIIYLILFFIALAICGCKGPVQTPSSDPALVGTKWNPGHYALINNNSNSDFFVVNPAFVSDVNEILFDKVYLDQFLQSLGSNFVGIQIGCLWRMLEYDKDVYDFTYIDDVLEVCASNKKQLQILLMDRSFTSQILPVPNYIIEDPKYQGGYSAFRYGHIMAWWDEDLVQRYIMLIQKLGEKYNEHKNLELICFTESALEWGNKSRPDEATNEKYVLYMYSRVEMAKQSFPNTIVLQGYNWGYTDYIPEHCVKNGIGFFGPDVVPDEERAPTKNRIPAYEDFVKYAGQIPLCCDIQSAELTKYATENGEFTIEGIYDMGVNVLKLNYMTWLVIEKENYYSFSKEVKPYIDSMNGEIKNTTVPSLLSIE